MDLDVSHMNLLYDNIQRLKVFRLHLINSNSQTLKRFAATEQRENMTASSLSKSSPRLFTCTEYEDCIGTLLDALAYRLKKCREMK